MVRVTRARTATRSEVGVTRNAMVNIDIILFVTEKENMLYIYIYIYIYSGYGKYSDPLKFFTLCYIAAIC